MIGEIFKLKNGTLSKQTFLMLMSIDESFVILFDNVNNSIIGDSTKGIDVSEYELSSMREMSEFIINNNL